MIITLLHTATSLISLVVDIMMLFGSTTVQQAARMAVFRSIGLEMEQAVRSVQLSIAETLEVRV